MMNSGVRAVSLDTLVKEWEASARRAFLYAENASTEEDKHSWERDAVCHYNCAQELKAALRLYALDTLMELGKERIKRKLGITPKEIEIRDESGVVVKKIAPLPGYTGDDD